MQLLINKYTFVAVEYLISRIFFYSTVACTNTYSPGKVTEIVRSRTKYPTIDDTTYKRQKEVG